MLLRKSMPDLKHMIRRLGGDSPPSEGRESLVNRILLFAPQQFKPDVKVERKKVVTLEEKDLRKAMKYYILRGLKLKVHDGCWFIKVRDRQDSGSLTMPLDAVLRCCLYMMPKDM